MTDAEILAAEKLRLERVDSYKIPAVNSNRFFLTVPDTNTIRIAFGEIDVGVSGTNYHSAVLMSRETALSLANIIIQFATPAPASGEGG